MANGSHPGLQLPSVDAVLSAQVETLDLSSIRLDYWRKDEFAVIDHAVPTEVLERIRHEVFALEPQVKRKSVWGYKSAGSLALCTLMQGAPSVVELYNSPVLLELLSTLAERPLLPCPESDPHAAAIYWYEHAGDRIGFHYDTSHYRGARFTVLLGLVDESSARLQCRLHTRERKREPEHLDVQTIPGRLVFFNGDKLLHAVSPLGPGERRIVLSLQYVTDPHMGAVRRALSMAKDSLTYFGTDAFRRPAHGDGSPR